MKTKLLKYTLTLGSVFFIIACSVKKDRFVNRNLHALSTEYNVLYNGNLALDSGLENLKTTFKDNFWEILPIERMPDKEESFLPGETKNENFSRAEEKAVKSIQKHSMNIDGSERNPQMDEAYLLLAKSRYYDNRFIPALEALNYILYKYPKSDRIYHAKVWREKVNIRLDNDHVAIQNLKKLLEKQNIKGQDLADANAMLTQAYRNTGSNDSAIATIKIARLETKDKEERARYSFILGQLYESFQYNDSAYVVFQEVIDMNRKVPRRYLIQAHAKQAQHFDYKNGDTLLFVEKFTKLIENRENRPFLDVLYHQMGVFYDKNQKTKIAEKFYNKSIRSNTFDDYLLASNYRNIGEIYFKEAEYKLAGKYYDSTLMRLNLNTREHRKYQKKKDNLVDVIKYETIAQENDSILKVVAMSEKERITYYQKFIDQLIIKDAEKAKLAEIEAEKQKNITANSQPKNDQINGDTPSFMSPPGQVPNIGNDISLFYFYNPVTVSYGKREFESKWGKRQYKENWRLSSDKTVEFSNDNSNNIDLVSDISSDSIVKVLDEKYTVEYYISRIPTSQEKIDGLEKDRNYAYYQLGVIYKEKFKEYQLAANKLEKLLENKPEERLVLPAKYTLYKIYEIINPNKAVIYKNEIASEYPDSRYAQILTNPEIALENNESPEVIYATIYKKNADGQIREAFEEVNQRVDQYFGDESLPKFELLKANISGRLHGLSEFKKSLNFVALTYPDNVEGKEAESLLRTNIPKLEALELGKEEVTGWKLVFINNFPTTEATTKLIEKINKYIKDKNSVLLKVSNDVYLIDKNCVVIHGFINKESTKSMLSVLKEYKEYKISEEGLVISTEDYRIIQIKKNLEDWITQNK